MVEDTAKSYVDGLKAEIKENQERIRRTDSKFSDLVKKQHRLENEIHEAKNQIILADHLLREGTWAFRSLGGDILYFYAPFSAFPKLVKLCVKSGIHESFSVKIPGENVDLSFDDNEVMLRIPLKKFRRVGYACGDLKVSTVDLLDRKIKLLRELTEIEDIELQLEWYPPKKKKPVKKVPKKKIAKRKGR